MEQEHWQPARLIPVSGIRGDDEQERRATSALLAVLTAVHEFERAVLKPLGAPSGKLSAFCEVPFELADGRNVRVDGVLQAVRGKTTGLKAWSPPAPRLPEADESVEPEQPEPQSPPPAEPASS